MGVIIQKQGGVSDFQVNTLCNIWQSSHFGSLLCGASVNVIEQEASLFARLCRVFTHLVFLGCFFGREH